MQHSLSEVLLLDNELYLEAVQHRHVSLKTLGLQEVRYDFNSVRNKTGKKQLRAVIPEDNQQQFLRRSGMISETIPTIPEENGKTKKRIRYRKRRAELEKAHLEESKDKGKSKPAVPESESPFVSHPARRTSIGGTPLFTKPSKTHLEQLEREREEAIARNKDKERQKKLGSSFDIVGPDGVKYVYDNRGFKVTEEQYQRQLDEAEREKKRLSHEKIVEPHGVELIEKTRRFVEELRKRVEMETVIDYRWYPGKFPGTTIPPRPQSAGALGSRGHHGTVRDFSSLGKSTRSPFRNGETPVLPMNLVCRWPEYRVMEEGDVVLTVEHCCHCAEHELITHHKEEQYVQLAEHVRDALSATAMKFAVRFYSVLKPIEQEDPLAKSLSQSELASSAKLLATGRTPPPPQHQCSSGAHKHLHDVTAFNIDYSKRMGAFEVQVAVKTRKDLVCHLLFSKLFRGVWPSIPTLQHLLERLLTEARFTRLAPEEEHVHRSPKGRRSGSPGKKTRRRSEEEDEEVPELHAAFDQREPPQTDSEPMSAARSRAISSEEAAGTATTAVSAMATAPAAAISADQVSGTATGESDATQERRTAQRPAPSSFSSSDGEAETLGFSPANSSRFGSTKATMLALGAAANGLNMLRAAKHQQESSPAAKISLAQAAQIAAQSIVKGFGAHKGEQAGGDQPQPAHADLTKKGSAIGVLSRQNAGGGKGRFLHIDEDANQHVQPEPEPHAQQQPAPVQELTIQTSTSARSPSVRSAPFTPKLPPVKMSDNEENEEELAGISSPSISSKSIAPVATVVQLTTTGLHHVRQRAASISDVPASVSVIDKLHSLALKGKATQSEKIQSKVPAPKPQTRSAHPSMEMRGRLDIGQLSRQNAGKVLVVPGDDSDDEPLGDDEADSRPAGMFASAMSAAAQAVNFAIEASAKRAASPEDPNRAMRGASANADSSQSESRASRVTTPAPTSVNPSPVPASSPAVSTANGTVSSLASSVRSEAAGNASDVATPALALEPAHAASAPAAPASTSASPATTPPDTSADPNAAAPVAKMSTAEVLQHKRLLADQLLLDMSAEYGEDFEEFSPSTKRAADGYEDLFEASEFRLDDEDASALA